MKSVAKILFLKRARDRKSVPVASPFHAVITCSLKNSDLTYHATPALLLHQMTATVNATCAQLMHAPHMDVGECILLCQYEVFQQEGTNTNTSL